MIWAGLEIEERGEGAEGGGGGRVIGKIIWCII
jgi:hypothetical protein